jgi:hypothetical protein
MEFGAVGLASCEPLAVDLLEVVLTGEQDTGMSAMVRMAARNSVRGAVKRLKLEKLKVVIIGPPGMGTAALSKSPIGIMGLKL